MKLDKHELVIRLIGCEEFFLWYTDDQGRDRELWGTFPEECDGQEGTLPHELLYYDVDVEALCKADLRRATDVKISYEIGR